MLSFYQHLPEHINPIAFSIGNFNIRWYSIMYLVGFSAFYSLIMFRVKRNESFLKISNFQFPISNEIPSSKLENLKLIQNSKFKIQNYLVTDFLLYSFIGLIIGARLGYVLFYNLDYFLQNPLAIVSPFGSDGSFTGIFGMSYFGGLLGIILAAVIFCRRNRINFRQWADFVVPAIPAGYFFGRIGNFLNGELYGKATDRFWGMYFGNELSLRHPTQLYEAFLEGAALFAVLWMFRNNVKFRGSLLSIYLFGYGIARFLVEFLREPERAPYFGFTTGQIMSLSIIVISLIIVLHKNKKAWYNDFNA